MKNTIILCFILCITSCSNQQSVSKENLFKSYYSQIKISDLPIQFDCYRDSMYQKYSYDNIDDSLKTKFKPQGGLIFGRLNVNKDIVSIIYMISADVYYPTIFTYRLDGTPIDILGLYKGESCDGFPGQSARSIAIIDKNNFITMSDTLWTCQVDSSYNNIANTDTITISDYKYTMLSNGHFKKTFEHVVKSAKID